MPKADPNLHIVHSLDTYINKPNPRFAIMINGEWGSGKTYFIKNYILDAYARFSKVSESQIEPPQFCHVSLFGLESAQEIDNAIFKALHPILASDKLKKIGNATEFILDKLPLSAGIINARDLKKIPGIIKAFIKSRSDRIILILDDFERCKMEPYALLGYINNQIENYKTHVIIIGSTEKIGLPHDNSPEKDNGESNQSSDSYSTLDKFNIVKEKVVGQTLHIEPDVPKALEFEINGWEDKNIRAILKEHLELILTIINDSSCSNMRNINKFLYEFSQLFYKLDKKYHKAQYLQLLVKHSLIFSIENHSRKQKFDKLFSSGALSWPLRHSLLHNKPKSEEEKFYDKYSFETDVLNPKFWHEFLDNGKIDEKALNQYFEQKERASEEKADLPLKLWDFTRLNEKDMDAGLIKIIDDLKTGKYQHPGVFLHAIGLLFAASQMRVLSISFADIEDLFDMALNNAQFKIPNHFFNDLFLYNGSLGYEYHAKDLPEFKNIVEILKTKFQQEDLENKQHELKRILLKIDSSFDDSLQELENLIKENKGFFVSQSYLENFSAKFISLDNAQLNKIFLRILALIDYHLRTDANKKLEIHPWINGFCDYLEQNMSSLHPLKQNSLNYFIAELKKKQNPCKISD